MKSLGSAYKGAFLALAALAVAGSAAAESLRVKSFLPPVEVRRVQSAKWFPVRVGLRLEPGDTVRAPGRARAELVLDDGTRMTLRPGSQMQIREVAPNRVFHLDYGRLKAAVKKLKAGRKFEVKTPVAAASVRGTVFEVGFDEEGQKGFLDVSRGAVALSQEGKEVLVPAGSRMEFSADLPLSDAPQKAEAGEREGAAEVRREVGLGMSKEEIMAAAAEEMRLAEYQEGKTLVDVNGHRVRLEEYIIRRPVEVAEADRDKAFKLVVLNERDNRFDYFYYRGVFNQSLPEDLSVALKDLDGKLGEERPSYYLREYEMAQSNTQDSVKDTASGGHHVKITYDGTTYTLSDPDNPSNTRTVTADEQSVVDDVTYHKIYDPVADKFTTVTDGQFAGGDFRPVVYDPADDGFRLFGAGDTFWRTGFNSYSHALNSVTKQSYAKKSTVANTLAVDLDANFTFAGGYVIASLATPSGSDFLHNRVTLFYGDGTTETVDTYVIDDQGKIGPLSAFAGKTTGQAFKTELLNWNYEQVITASEFQGRKIDLVVEPKILIKSGLIQ